MMPRRMPVAFVCLVLNGCLTHAYQYGAHEENKAFLRTQQAPVTVAGTVRDADGTPLRGVRVRFERTYLRPTWDNLPPGEAVTVRGSKSVSGRFRLSWPDSESVLLWFEKRGYVPFEMRVDVAKSVPPTYHGVTSPQADAVRLKDVDVIMVAEVAGG